jgi:hypothetical protein
MVKASAYKAWLLLFVPFLLKTLPLYKAPGLLPATIQLKIGFFWLS